jgi:hypothetical protein
MKAQFKVDFDNWIAGLSPGCANMTTLFPKSKFRPPMDLEATELVDQFLELHPQHRGPRSDLLQYAREGRTNGVYVVSLDSWNQVRKQIPVT